MFEERVEKEERFVFTSLSLYSPYGFKKGRSSHPAIRGFTLGGYNCHLCGVSRTGSKGGLVELVMSQ